MNHILVQKKLKQFLLEDIGEGDLTSEAIFPLTNRGKAHFIAKDHGILAGIHLIHMTYSLLDQTIDVSLFKKDGDIVKRGDIIATVQGPVRHILTGERLILNLLQRMSGIATATYQAVSLIDDNHTRICDTRKTTPGLRVFEKYAVTCGGGFNHRHGLYDGVMIKDNHIAFAGSISKAVQTIKAKLGQMIKVEVETETEEQVIEAIHAGADIIMFDNRSPEEIIELNKLVPKHITTEVSGGITLDSLPLYKNTGVDYISLGFLTHSVQALDISLIL